MKYIKSKVIRKSRGNSQGIYQITLEVTDHDINMMEDIATCYCTVGGPKDKIGLPTYDKEHELKPEYSRWAKKHLFHSFWRLWKEHDD